ncbi:Panacea domain-containing protein [Streptococcus tangpeifui]|uniref:Panacea domain-containing protein n=1 Tax=Streptococcus tangpeifui TaxID=2709400 RepID=UPI0013EAB19A|nr:type II toxin-antitoxin system antitoxin SocA domain-containing protein [Streptococcus sp. ZJ1593]
MVQHIIAIASSYRLGKRIAWHYTADVISKDVLTELRDKTDRLLGRPDYVIHKLTTDSKDWSSVVNKDSFFADLEVYDSLDDFLQVVAADKEITALDIAKYLLSVLPMSNLKLQKMIYLVYADYLTKTGKRLFEDKIIAMQYGPVIPTVYDNYKGNGKEEIAEASDDKTDVHLDGITVPLTLAKMLQADDNQTILASIKATLEIFGKKSAGQLVDITHRAESPWSQVRLFDEITDNIILKYHNIELV